MSEDQMISYEHKLRETCRHLPRDPPIHGEKLKGQLAWRQEMIWHLDPVVPIEQKILSIGCRGAAYLKKDGCSKYRWS